VWPCCSQCVVSACLGSENSRFSSFAFLFRNNCSTHTTHCNMALQRYGISTLFGLAALLFLSTTTRAQVTGTVTINLFPDYDTASAEVRDCLYLPGHKDVAYSMGCPTDTVYNYCYCPTGTAGLWTASSAITGCLTAWYSQTGALEVATAVSIYNAYCTKALALATTTGSSFCSSPTASKGCSSGS
jgi:hypothetical protein